MMSYPLFKKDGTASTCPKHIVLKLPVMIYTRPNGNFKGLPKLRKHKGKSFGTEETLLNGSLFLWLPGMVPYTQDTCPLKITEATFVVVFTRLSEHWTCMVGPA